MRCRRAAKSIELQRGSTPLDFAYHVHTDLGHRCRGAKVNGRMVPLNTVLANGDQVEIVTGKQLNPSRDWLVPSLGYLASPRNRSKVRAWFRKLDEEQNQQQGKQILERELQRLAIHSVTLPELIGEFNFNDGRPAVPGDRRRRDQRRADQRRGPAPRQAAGAALTHLAPADGQRRRKPRASRSKASATCCRPLRAAADRCRRKQSRATSRWDAASASIATTAPASAGCGRRIPSASSPWNGASRASALSRST